MRSSSLALMPFEAEHRLRAFNLDTQVWRRTGSLEICYQLQGPIEALVLPAPAEQPRRLDDLWQSTCFEAFIALAGSPAYWEINLSPTGDWNVYRLTDYRQDLEPEPACDSLAFSSKRNATSIELTVGLDLGLINPAGQPLEVAVAAVIEERAVALSHWALAHPAPVADFHHRGGFVLRV